MVVVIGLRQAVAYLSNVIYYMNIAPGDKANKSRQISIDDSIMQYVSKEPKGSNF